MADFLFRIRMFIINNQKLAIVMVSLVTIVFIIVALDGGDKDPSHVEEKASVEKSNDKITISKETEQEFLGIREIISISPFKDFSGTKVDQDLFSVVGPFAIYAKKIGNEMTFVVYTAKWHGNKLIEDILPLPIPYIAFIADNNRMRISTNTDKYEVVELKKSLDKNPENAGMYAEGRVKLKSGSKYEDVAYVKGIIQAQFPQKAVQYTLNAENDFRAHYKIDAQTSMLIYKHEEGKAKSNYSLLLRSATKIPMSIDFKDKLGNVLNKDGVRPIKVGSGGYDYYDHVYTVNGDVDHVIVTFPFDYKSKSYPFFMKHKVGQIRVNKNTQPKSNYVKKPPVTKSPTMQIPPKVVHKDINPGQDNAAILFEYLQQARKGSVEAQYWAGYMIFKGMGTQQNHAEGLRWLKSAAAGGNVKAKEALKDPYNMP